MPITQDRIRSLVEESERNLSRMRHMLSFIQDICASPNVSNENKWRAILANAPEYLGSHDYVFTILERERIKHNWRRNERSADKMRKLRDRRDQGLDDLHKPVPRKRQTQHMISPETYPIAAPVPIPLPGEPQTPSDLSFAEPQAPAEPSAYDIELARARELGDQERARNAERLARAASGADLFGNGRD